MRRVARPRLASPDRLLLEETIFPAIYRDRSVRRILFVGVSEFTSWYPTLFRTRAGLSFETADPREDAASFGARGAHWQSRFEEIPRPDPPYDVIILNGTFEYGTDSAEEKLASVTAAWEMLRPGGLALIGYRDRQPAPDIDLETVGSVGFRPAAIPGMAVAKHRTDHPNGHTYAGFERP
jgi:hypothetical protein